MRRGRPGLAGIQSQINTKKAADNVSQQMEATQIEHIRNALSKFKVSLESFAAEHRNEINSNLHFRAQFNKLCSQLGVDPLASRRGFWSEMLGVGDFYYSLSVQLIDAAIYFRNSPYGPMIPLSVVILRINKQRGTNKIDLSEDDISRAVQSMAVLGTGYKIVSVNNVSMLFSIPNELNNDHFEFLKLASTAMATSNEGVTKKMIAEKFNWTNERIDNALNMLMNEGIVWVDLCDLNNKTYWVPSLISNSNNSNNPNSLSPSPSISPSS